MLWERRREDCQDPRPDLREEYQLKLSVCRVRSVTCHQPAEVRPRPSVVRQPLHVFLKELGGDGLEWVDKCDQMLPAKIVHY